MHEQSETIQNQLGRWLNVFGRGTPNAGSRLPRSGSYPNVGQAEGAAGLRSLQSREPGDPMSLQRMYERSYTPPIQEGQFGFGDINDVSKLNKLMQLLGGFRQQPEGMARLGTR